MRGFTLGEQYQHRGSAIWGAGDVETAGSDTGDRWAKISSWGGGGGEWRWRVPDFGWPWPFFCAFGSRAGDVEAVGGDTGDGWADGPGFQAGEWERRWGRQAPNFACP
jgi:hypothetical protein